MATITGVKAQNNSSQFYFIHTIDGLTYSLLGENLLNSYIDKNPKKYNLYIECETDSSLLDNHKDLVSTVSGNDGNILYVFEIAKKYRNNYDYFRLNQAHKFTKDFTDGIIKLSGMKDKVYEKSKKGKVSTKELLQIDNTQKALYVCYVLKDIYDLDLYEDFLAVPQVSPKSPIRSWEEFIKVFYSIVRGEKNMDIMYDVISKDFKYVDVADIEYIENY